MLLVGVAPECKGAPRCCTAREVDSRWTTTAHQTKGELAPQAWPSTHQTRTTLAFSLHGPLLPLPWPLPPLLSAAALAPLPLLRCCWTRSSGGPSTGPRPWTMRPSRWAAMLHQVAETPTCRMVAQHQDGSCLQSRPARSAALLSHGVACDSPPPAARGSARQAAGAGPAARSTCVCWIMTSHTLPNLRPAARGRARQAVCAGPPRQRRAARGHHAPAVSPLCALTPSLHIISAKLHAAPC